MGKREAYRNIPGKDSVHAIDSPLQVDGRGPCSSYESCLSNDAVREAPAVARHAVRARRVDDGLLSGKAVRIRSRYAYCRSTSDGETFDSFNDHLCFTALDPVSG